MATDRELLTKYAADGSEPAFAEMVRRHAGKVYATCRQVLGDAHAAEDAAQATFLILVEKARRLPADTVLAGWLYLTARNAALNLKKAHAVRARHEREMTGMDKRGSEDASWAEARPLLPELLALLPEGQRNAVILRHLHGLSPAETAAEMGCSESSVSALLSRGLARLRAGLARRGVVVPAVALAGLLGEQAVVPVPAGLAAAVEAACLGKAAASQAALSAARGVMDMMLWTKVKMIAVVVAAVAAVGASGGVVVARLSSGKPAPPRSARILAMGDNTWLKLAPPREANTRMFCGGCLGDGKIWFWGGGHSGHQFNDMEVYDIAANRWTKITESEGHRDIRGAWPIGGGSSTSVLSPRLQPLVFQTHQQTCWLPEQRRVFGALSGAGTWWFDPAQSRWEPLAGMHAGELAGKAGPLVPSQWGEVPGHDGMKPAPIAWKTRDGREVVRDQKRGSWKTTDGNDALDVDANPAPHFSTGQGLVLYDPILKRPLCLARGQLAWSFNVEKMQWEELCPAPVGGGGVSYFGTFIPDGGYHLIVHEDSGWWKFDAGKKKSEAIANVPEPLKKCQSMAYDTANRRLLALSPVETADKGLAIDVWTWDSAAGAFEKLPRPAAVPQGKRPAGFGKFNTFWYDADHNVCIFLVQQTIATKEVETWAYRYKQAGE